MDTLAIIKRIELRIAELGMSKADFYKQSGISSASYSQWNTGRYKPTEKKLASAAACLGVSMEYLRDGTETKKAPTESGERKFKDDEIMFALSRGGEQEITVEMFEEVKRFAAYVAQRENKGK